MCKWRWGRRDDGGSSPLLKNCSFTMWQCEGMMLLAKRGNPSSEANLQLAASPGSLQVQDADTLRRGCSWRAASVCSAIPWSVPPALGRQQDRCHCISHPSVSPCLPSGSLSPQPRCDPTEATGTVVRDVPPPGHAHSQTQNSI